MHTVCRVESLPEIGNGREPYPATCRFASYKQQRRNSRPSRLGKVPGCSWTPAEPTHAALFFLQRNSGLFSHFLLLGERERNSTDRLGHCIPKGERSRGSCHGREYRPHMMFSVRAAEVVAPVSFNNSLITVCEVWPDSVTARSVFTRW